MNKYLALLLLSGFAALSASAADTRIITFKEAIRIGLERNVALRQAQNAAETSAVGVSEARMQFVPNLNLGISGSESVGRSFDQAEGRVVNQTSRSVGVNLSSGLNLFNGFANVATLRGAKLTNQAGQWDLERARETVLFQVATDFLSLIQAQEQLRVQHENLAAQSNLEQKVQTYVDAGSRTVSDLYQQQANVASARLAVVQSERSVELARVELMSTLQLDPAGVYDFQPPATEELAASSELPTFEQMLAQALAKRVDLSAEAARVAAAEQSERVARSGYWPGLNLSAGYGSGYTTTSPFSFSQQLDQRRGGSLGLSLSIPVFDRHSTANATRKAQLRTESAHIALDNARQQVGLQVRRVQLDHRTAREQLSTAEAQKRSADLALDSVQQRYRAGAATLVEVSQAQASQVQAASTWVSARYNLLFQRTLADYYIGDLEVARFSK